MTFEEKADRILSTISERHCDGTHILERVNRYGETWVSCVRCPYTEPEERL